MSPKTYKIGNMDCAHCAQEVETGVRRLEGVESVQVDFASGKMTLIGEVPFETLRTRIEALGKTIDAPTAAPQPTRRGGVIGFWDYLLRRVETRLALVGGGLIVVTLIGALLFQPASAMTAWLYTIAMLIALYPIARSGFNALRINREFNINLLMTIAAVGAIAIGEYLEGATVIFLFAIGEALEGYTADRARDSLRSLMELAPAQATRIFHAGELLPVYNEETVPVEQLAVDDVILVRPGDRVAMDGTVIQGSSAVNQAPITGESIPVHKEPGEEVFAGSINGDGVLQVRLTHLAADNTLNRIIQMVEEAQSVRAPSQRLIDRFAHYYTPAVTGVALLVALIPPLLFGQPFYDAPGEAHGWLYRALTLLVIACPCALVISTPVTIISAITAAARRGVLIKGGAHLEALGTVRAVAFDKTGTLTYGRPIVTQMRSVDCATGMACGDCDDVLALAAAVERQSTHPLAQAVTSAAQTRGLAQMYAPAQAVTALTGRGVQGVVEGKQVTVGSHRLFDSDYPHSTDLCRLVNAAEADGQTAMLLSDGDRVRGFIAVADEVRDDSQPVMAQLKALEMRTVMLTGDNRVVAAAVAAQVGVDEYRAELMPQDKVEAVRGLLAQYQQVAMVGDGINDTPALAAATVGVAMGGAGSVQAMETADIALMADDLKQLPFAIDLSRFARRLIKANITLSLVLKLAFVLLALTGVASLWLAVLADVGMSLVVTLNGMRPLRFRSAPVHAPG